VPVLVRALADVPGATRMTVSAPNREQLAAIEAPGVVFVSAGAGTGKTTVLVERYVRAVCDRGLDIESILVITYTERAAGELWSRIRRRLVELDRHELARELDGAWISTIHGFCHRLLKAHPFAAGIDPRYRVLDESQARVIQSEALQEALTAFCAGGDAERLRLLATYGARGLRRMVTGAYETLRSAGRPLELELGGESGLEHWIAELRDAAGCLLDEGPDDTVARLLELLDGGPASEELLDLSGYAAKGRERERFATYEVARHGVERGALEDLARRDRDLLQELLAGFAVAYRAAKDRESALDFEDLQLYARDLLRDNEEIRERERWRLRSIMVDEFQDTNRLQCELIDLLAGAPTGSRGAAGGAGPEGIVLGTDPESPVPPAASGGGVAGLRPAEADTGRGLVEELFFVGDEFQSIYRFRHADVEVFRERREQTGGVLALTENYRSRPEVLDVINHLFSGDFGESFQPLSAAGRFPDPAFGPAVELLVTDKSTYSGTGIHWRKAEARHVARRLREMVDAGEATPGEIVLLFAAGTDARLYEDELRGVGLPTFRATGRDYYSRQQVVDLLGYLRLLHNRYDDEALVTVLASPFVGVSNDALVLLRRAAGRRPLYAGLERGLPEGIDERDARLFQAFRQRYERLAERAGALSLERLCEQIVIEHDYDLAVLAQKDGRRRYANMRKLARLARSYEELRGRNIEGFVRFVREQDTVGASELEAVAEEEDTDVIRLLTIHAAKGLEFKVVVVADAGRDRSPSWGDEVLALPDGRLGFKVAHPATGKRMATSVYDQVKEAEEEAEKAERRRLYYVAMTRAVDRLIVSGSLDAGKANATETPIGWVLERLGPDELEQARGGPLEVVRGDARLVLRVDRYSPDAEERVEAADEETQLSLFAAGEPVPVLVEVPALPDLIPVPEPPAYKIRRLSYSALALFERCSYRFYAERVVGLRAGRPAGEVRGEGGLAPTEIGDAVHTLLEGIDLSAPRVPDDLEVAVRARYPQVSEEEIGRIRTHVAAYCDSELAARVAALPGATAERPFAFEHDGVVFHGRLDMLHRAGGRALVVDYKTNVLDERSTEEVVEHEYSIQRLVYALACLRAGAEEVEVVHQFLERPDAVVSAAFTRADLPGLEAELSEAIAHIQAGEFRPTPSEFVCADCPVLGLVCAGPALRDADPSTAAYALAAL
jgi:ATP-dependent helicase/nuclease subunit A